MSEPLTEDRLEEISTRPTYPWTMASGCTDYACYCHADAKELVAEVRRLRDNAWLSGAVTEIAQKFDLGMAGVAIMSILVRHRDAK